MLKAVYAEGCEKYFEPRRIKYAFHDIDGTHSLIRNWPPVMSAVLNDVIENGISEGFDDELNTLRLIETCGKQTHEETDKFCVESAGMSALTQMEWAIRRAAQEGKIKLEFDSEANDEIIKRIWQGEERFNDISESTQMQDMLAKYTPRLFKLYERVLNGYCRDKNLESAKQNPDEFLVKGSKRFINMLNDAGVKNYFVTGAVVQRGMGMFEEVEALGFEIGAGRQIEDIIGSTWDKKLPKDEIMLMLLKKLGAAGEDVLVTGDGRSEISAGVKMNALCISRLNPSATRQRQLHRQIGTNMIVADFEDELLTRAFTKI